MFEKLLTILERIAIALEGGSTADTPAAPKPRGRKATGEVNGVAVTPPTPEQLAAAQLAASAAAATTAQTASAATNAGAEKPVVTQPTLQQVADAIIATANSVDAGKGRDAAVKILTDHGVKKVPELKPEQYASVMAAVAALAAPAAGAGGLV